MPDQSSAATEHAILQEITAPLETLPDDPLSVINADFPTALRGYDRLAVEDYVRRTRQLVAELQATRSPEAAVRRALERVGEQISGILQRAHETAEQITAQSRSEAEDRMQQARSEAAQIAGAAERRVRELDADTDRIWLERQRIVADAEDLASQLLALARTAAERFPDDAEDGDPPEPVQYDVEPRDQAAGEAASYAEGDEDFGDEPPAAASHRQSEIERTMAFAPLTPSEPEADSPPAADEDSHPPEAQPDAPGAAPTHVDPRSAGLAPPGAAGAPPAAGPQDHPQPVADDDATAVIPPASQAANERFTR